MTVVGDAGIGKSRLTREFVASVADGALVARGRCLPYGEGITFWPLVEIVREAAGIHEEDSSEVALSRLVECLGDEEVVERVSSAIGLSTAEFSLPELFWGFQRFIEVLGRRGPVVLVIDDIHWAEATLLDLLEHLLTAPMEAAALIVCTSRDDVREARPSWGDQTNAQHCVLKPLTDADASQIAEAMLHEAGIAGEIRKRVIQAAEGNPLFVEQMLSMLVDQGAVGENGRGGAAGRFDVSIPPTIEGLLAARLDSLGAGGTRRRGTRGRHRAHLPGDRGRDHGARVAPDVDPRIHGVARAQAAGASRPDGSRQRFPTIDSTTSSFATLRITAS